MGKCDNQNISCEQSCNDNINPNQKDSKICVSTKEICYKGCQLCKDIDTKPIPLNKCTNRILKLNITLRNVCFNKPISIGVILCDRNGTIVAYRCFNAELRKPCDCGCCKPCGTLNKKVTFILPESDICCPYALVSHVVANYVSPCDMYDSCEYYC